VQKQKLTSINTSERITLPLWRSLHSLNLMLPKEDRKAMLLRLFNDDSPLTDHFGDRFLRDTRPHEAENDSVMKDENIDAKDETPNDDVDLIEERSVSGDDDEGGENIGKAGLDPDVPARGPGKGVNAKEEFFGTSVAGGLDTSGQGGG